MLPRLRVDFNEIIEPNLVLLSRNDIKIDSLGIEVLLYDGLKVLVYDEDMDESNRLSNLCAMGVVELNTSSTSWALEVKWCCRINELGIKHEVG